MDTRLYSPQTQPGHATLRQVERAARRYYELRTLTSRSTVNGPPPEQVWESLYEAEGALLSIIGRLPAETSQDTQDDPQADE